MTRKRLPSVTDERIRARSAFVNSKASAEIVTLPVIRRFISRLDQLEQADREQGALRENAIHLPHRARPLLVIDNTKKRDLPGVRRLRPSRPESESRSPRQGDVVPLFTLSTGISER